MNRFQTAVSTFALFVAGLSFAGCTPGGVGDPCIPEDEYRADVAGYGIDEVNVEAMSFQCETRLCLVNHFQGRVTCPYGQASKEIDANGNAVYDLPDALRCKLPDATGDLVTVDVLPQLYERQARSAVYCSCRCDGPDKNARYCQCPSGYSCTMLNDIELGSSGAQLLGSYCVRKGTAYVKGSRLDESKYCSPYNETLYCPYEGAAAPNINPFGK